MKKKYFLPFVWIFLFVTTSCISDFDLLNTSADIKIDESLVLPIGEGSVTVEELLKKFGLPENFDTTGNEIAYHQSFSYEYTYDKLNLADTIKPFMKTIILSPTPIVVPPNYPIDLPLYDATVELPINSSKHPDERVDSAVINSARMKVQVDVSPDLLGIPATAFKIEFVFPDSMMRIDNGTKPTFEPVAYGQVGYINIGKTAILLKGANKIPFKIKVYMKPQSAPILISPTSNVILNMKFEDVNLSVVYGLFKLNVEYEGTYDLPINMNDYLPNSLLKFANPKLDISATTNVGMSIDLKVNYLKVYNKANPTNVFDAMFFDPITGTKNLFLTDAFNGPTTVGNSIVKDFNQFNSVNGEIDKVFDNKPYPDVLNYKVTLTSNASRISNFITTDNNLKLDVKASIPLQLKGGSQFTLTDTIKNLNIGTLLDNVDSAVLVLKVKNGFPVKAKYRMTYWKSNLLNDTIPAIGGSISTIVDDTAMGNLTSQFLLSSPTVKADGSVDEIVPQSIKIMLNKSQISALKLSKFIIYTLVLESSEKDDNGVITSNPANFSTKNSFGVKLGLFVKGSGIINPFNN